MKPRLIFLLAVWIGTAPVAAVCVWRTLRSPLPGFRVQDGAALFLAYVTILAFFRAVEATIFLSKEQP